MEFTPGYTVLTGETGAGKSILIDGLNLALGERGDREMVRVGSEEAVVEALFDISELSEVTSLLRSVEVPLMGDELVLRRTVTTAGRSRCSANGSTVPLGILKRLGDLLVDLHGQHEHQLLLNPAMHLEFLDAFGELLPSRAEVRGAFFDWKYCREELEGLRSRERERAQRVDLLSFQVEELEAARLKTGEEEELAAERSRLANVQRIFSGLAQAYGRLMGEGGGRESLGSALADLRSVAEHDRANLEPQAEVLSRLLDALLDQASEIRALQEKMEADPKRLEEIEERLDTLARFKRKYGESTEAMLEFLQKAKAEFAELASSDEKIRELEAREEEFRKELSSRAGRLSEGRQRNANLLAERVARELRELAMDNADFGVKMIQMGDQAGPVEVAGSRYKASETGIDSVEFYIAPNVGAGTHPLKDIASGGELSRVMLALKSVLAKVDRVGTLVFDEIDAGIGGRVAEVVGKKLHEIGEKRQVLCITHLPQIAARASGHWHVRKLVSDHGTIVEAKKVGGKDRIKEIARMVAGEEVSDTAIQHAERLLKGE